MELLLEHPEKSWAEITTKLTTICKRLYLFLFSKDDNAQQPRLGRNFTFLLYHLLYKLSEIFGQQFYGQQGNCLRINLMSYSDINRMQDQN